MAIVERSIHSVRWEDSQKRVGPCIYFKSKYGRIGAHLTFSEENGNYLDLSWFSHNLVIPLPLWLGDPGKDKEEGECDRRYGFSTFEWRSLHYHYGNQTNSSLTDKTGVWFFPWTEWEHVRHSMLDLNAVHYVNILDGMDWTTRKVYEQRHSAVFAVKDYDGEEFEATVNIEEREWRFGSKKSWWRIFRLFRKPKIRRSLNVEFSKEIGPKKGSWKGGTIGMGVEIPLEIKENHLNYAMNKLCIQERLTPLKRVR